MPNYWTPTFADIEVEVRRRINDVLGTGQTDGYYSQASILRLANVLQEEFVARYDLLSDSKTIDYVANTSEYTMDTDTLGMAIMSVKKVSFNSSPIEFFNNINKFLDYADGTYNPSGDPIYWFISETGYPLKITLMPIRSTILASGIRLEVIKRPEILTLTGNWNLAPKYFNCFCQVLSAFMVTSDKDPSQSSIMDSLWGRADIFMRTIANKEKKPEMARRMAIDRYGRRSGGHNL